MKPLPLHWKIVIGMVLGVIVGLVATTFNDPEPPPPVPTATEEPSAATVDALPTEIELPGSGGAGWEKEAGELRRRIEVLEDSDDEPSVETTPEKPAPKNHGTQFVQNWIAPFGTIF